METRPGIKDNEEGIIKGKNVEGRPRLAYNKRIVQDVGCGGCEEMKRLLKRRAQ